MKVRLFVVFVVLLLSGFLSTTEAQTKPCGCENKEYLLEALNQNQMVIQELQLQTDLILALENADGKRIMPTAEAVTDLYTAIRNAKKSIANANYLYTSGESMNTADCSVTREDTSNDCVELIRKHFYDVTQKACLANKSSRRPDQTYFEEMEMKSYLLHLMMAYHEQQKFILQMLKSLPKNCRPSGWFGYIVLNRVGTGITVITTPPRPIINGRGLNGGTAEDIQKWTYIGKILVEEGKAKSIRGSAVYSEDSVSTSSEQAFCDSIIGSKTRSHTITFKTSAGGEAEGDVVAASQFTLLKVNPANQTYDLFARNFPRVNTTGQKVHWSKSTGGCRKDQETNRTETFTSSSPENGHSITNEKIKPGSSDYLEGSRVVKPAEGNKSSTQGNTSMTITQELHLRWMLRRLPSK